MTPRSNLSIVALAVLLILFAPVAVAGVFDVSATCPTTAQANQAVVATVTLTNRSCSPGTARLITGVVGNGNQTLGGLGVYGPVVANPVVAIPAAIDLFPPDCYDVTLGSNTFSLTTAPTLPTSLVGTVATIIIVAEFDGDAQTAITECLVEVLPGS